MKTFTRKDYLDGKCSHRAFYSQLVTPEIKQLVSTIFGKDRLAACLTIDNNLNNIPLHQWDRIAPQVSGELFKKVNCFYSLAGAVCVLKEAARQVVEENKK